MPPGNQTGQNDGRHGERGGPGAAIAYRGIVDETHVPTNSCLFTRARVIYIAKIARTSWLPRGSTSGASRQPRAGHVPSDDSERAAPPCDHICRPSTHGDVPDTGEGASVRVERAAMARRQPESRPVSRSSSAQSRGVGNGLRARARLFLLREPRLVSYLRACPSAVHSIEQPKMSDGVVVAARRTSSQLSGQHVFARAQG